MEKQEERLAAAGEFRSAFDRVAGLAARMLDTPIATVSVVDERRIRFIGRHGLDLTETPREPGLCGSAVAGDGLYVLDDASADSTASGNRLVRGGTGVRFYAAAVIEHEGRRVGTVTVMDRRPRRLDRRQLTVLEDLAAVVADVLQSRFEARDVVEAERALRQQSEHEKRLLEEMTTLEADQARQLQRALDRRVAIEQAKGMLMAREGLAEEEAFERLRMVARSQRRPVEELARRVIAGEALPRLARSSRQRSRGSRRRDPQRPQPQAEPTDGEVRDALLRITRLAEAPGLRVEGEIDQSNAALLARALDAVTGGGGSVHLDLQGLEFMDLAGLRVLVSTAGQLPAGRSLVLHSVRPYLRRIMELVGWDRAPGLRIGDDQS